MPRLPIDYSKTIIYRIVCKDPTITECYVGHTTDFKTRKRIHKSDCNNTNTKNYTAYVYQFIRGHGNWENWNMIMIEEYPCKNINEATKQERVWIEKLQSKLNSLIPSRTLKDIKKQKQDYYEANKTRILDKKHEPTICDCGSILTTGHIKRHKRSQTHIQIIEQRLMGLEDKCVI